MSLGGVDGRELLGQRDWHGSDDHYRAVNQCLRFQPGKQISHSLIDHRLFAVTLMDLCRHQTENCRLTIGKYRHRDWAIFRRL